MAAARKAQQQEAAGPEAVPAPPRPVIAVEYNGTLYPSIERAEHARCTETLYKIVDGEAQGQSFYDPQMSIYHSYRRSGAHEAISKFLEHPETVREILARYLEAKKISDHQT